MSMSTYHVRPIAPAPAYSVTLEGFPGHDRRPSERHAKILACALAMANPPSVVLVHGALGEVCAEHRYLHTIRHQLKRSRHRPN